MHIKGMKGTFLISFKETVSEISIEPQCKDGNADDSKRFPKRLCLMKYELDIKVFEILSFSIVVSSQKCFAHFYYWKTYRNYRK